LYTVLITARKSNLLIQ